MKKIVLIVCILTLAGCKNDSEIEQLKADVKLLSLQTINVYDSNDLAYKFIAPAPKEWTDKFGDNERTRLIHSISELRVVVAGLTKKVLTLEKQMTILRHDVNDLSEPKYIIPYGGIENLNDESVKR